MSRRVLKISAVLLFSALLFISGSLYASARFMERQQQQQAAGNLNGAIGAASAAGRFDPFSVGSLQAQSSILFGQGRNAAAKELMDQAQVREPDNHIVYLSLGNIAMEMGDFEEAEQSYLEAERLDPLGYSARSGLAQAYLQQNKLEEAGVEYEKLLESNQLDTMAFYNFGRVQVRTGEPEEGVKNIRRAIRLAQAELARVDDADLRRSQVDLIESMRLAEADGHVVLGQYNRAYEIVESSNSSQAPALMELIGNDPQSYGASVIDSDIY